MQFLEVPINSLSKTAIENNALAIHNPSILKLSADTIMTTTVVHIRVDGQINKQTTEIATLDLSVPHAIRFVLAEASLSFAIRVPNAETKAAIKACRRGEIASFNHISELMTDLNNERSETIF